MKSTLDSIFKVAFGVELDSMCGTNEEGIKFSNAFDDASALTLFRYVDVFWKLKRALGVGSEAKLKTSVQVINKFVYKLISNKTELMNKSEDDPSVGDCFLCFTVCFMSVTMSLCFSCMHLRFN